MSAIAGMAKLLTASQPVLLTLERMSERMHNRGSNGCDFLRRTAHRSGARTNPRIIDLSIGAQPENRELVGTAVEGT
jgi:hypothetical protein